MTAPRDPRILEEQLRTLNRHLPPALLAHLLVGTVVIVTLSKVFPFHSVAIWGATTLAMIALRLAANLYYRLRARPESTDLHLRLFLIGSAISGMIWGSLGVFFYADAFEFQLFVLFVLVGMSSGATFSLTAYLPAFNAFFPIAILPIGVVLIADGEPIQFSLGLTTLAYIGIVSYFARANFNTLEETLRLRYENVDLVRELSAQKEQAEQANHAKSRFLAAASHDLRQPLHALTLYISLFDEATESPRARELLGRVNRSVEALQHLFNALLDISKLEAGTLVPERESFTLQSLLDRLGNDFMVEAGQRGLRLVIVPSDEVVHSDPVLLEQILRNYLSNALRYTEQGSIILSAERMGGVVRIAVTDTGIGIRESQQQLIFQEFYQVDRAFRDRGEGLGLGLAIVSRVARLLDHGIGVHSQAGEGSVFTVEVPVGDAADLVADPPAQTVSQASCEKALRMVVIDDDPAVRDSTRQLLDSWGCETVAIASLDEAFTALGNDRPDGIVADYRLRGGRTGIDAIRALHTRYGARPGVVISGDVAATPLREIQESGLQLLHKPVAPAKLRVFLNTVRRAAAQRETA